MSGIPGYFTTPGSNTSLFPEGQFPSSLNDSSRQVQADIRSWYADPIWIQYGVGTGPATITYVSSTSFKVEGADVTAIYHAKRRVKITGTATTTVYGKIASSSFSTDTTVTLTLDSGSLVNETLTVYISSIPADHSPIPGITTTLGTAAAADTGTSGDTLPFLSGDNTWSGDQTVTGALVQSGGSSQGEITAQSARTDAGTVGKFAGEGTDSASAATEYGALAVTSVTRTDGSEVGEVQLQACDAGTEHVVVLKARGGNGVQIGDASGDPTGGFKGAGTLNVKGGIYTNGTVLGTVAVKNTGTTSGTVPLVGTASASTSLAGLVALATAAEVLAGSDSAKAATAAALAGSKSLGQTGYYKLPGGLQIKWGFGNASSSSADTTVSFDEAFPTACAWVRPYAYGIASSQERDAPVLSQSASGFTFNITSSGGGRVSEAYRWLAVGY